MPNCSWCPAFLKSAKTLKVHVNDLHLSFHRVPCTEEDCGLYFLPGRRAHHQYQYHGSVASRTCSVCQLTFNTRATRAAHIIRVHMETVGPRYVCPQCGRDYSAKTTMTSHIMAEHQGLTHRCEVCGREYRYLRNLSQHVRFRHRQGVASSCTLCARSFSEPRGLLQHQDRVHPRGGREQQDEEDRQQDGEGRLHDGEGRQHDRDEGQRDREGGHQDRDSE